MPSIVGMQHILSKLRGFDEAVFKLSIYAADTAYTGQIIVPAYLKVMRLRADTAVVLYEK